MNKEVSARIKYLIEKNNYYSDRCHNGIDEEMGKALALKYENNIVGAVKMIDAFGIDCEIIFGENVCEVADVLINGESVMYGVES